MRPMLIIVLLAAMLVSGCKEDPSTVNSNDNGNANTSAAQSFKPPAPIKPVDTADPNFKPCNPYFPLVPGSIAKYVINYSSGIVGDLTVVIDATDEDGRKVFTQRSQLVDRSGGMQIVQTITRKFVCDGERVIILSEKTESNVAGQSSTSDFEYRENSLIMTDPKSMLIKGSTWTHAFRPVFHTPGGPSAPSDAPTVIAFQVGIPQDVTIGVGTFKAVPITRKIGDNSTVDYYVAGLGLVSRRSHEGTSWELKEYSGLQPVN
ncbi:MAG TPA: hypothetical protein VLG74_16025 [Blastocatellia bacterium]|nr:hypothetical protein [Blastocatellia bacterium]